MDLTRLEIQKLAPKRFQIWISTGCMVADNLNAPRRVLDLPNKYF
ncbi:hypothetical protein AYX15_06992 [Cryptococcus neoformans]|nr:hypothetical protein AYX15_06992 [Cryptococcus neoformans var. grubii]